MAKAQWYSANISNETPALAIQANQKEQMKLLQKKNLLIISFFLFIVYGIILCFKFPIFSPIDERSHFNYIEYLSTKYKIPILDKDPVSWQSIALDTKTYPKRPDWKPTDRIKEFGMTIYEGFQPPLAYLISTPFFFLGGSNYYNKVYLIRIFNFSLLVLTILIAYRTFKKLKLPTYSLIALATLPGLILRSATISNASTEIFLSSLIFYLLLFWLKPEKIETKKIIIIGLLIGATALTKLTALYLLPASLLYLLFLYKKIDYRLIYILIVPLVLLAPWLLWNHHQFGSFTANSIAQQMQAPIIYANGHFNGMYFLNNLDNFFNRAFFIAEDQGLFWYNYSIIRFLNIYLCSIFSISVIFFIVKLISLTLKKKFNSENSPFLLASLFFLGNLAICFYIGITWTYPVGRYLYPTILPLFICLTYFSRELFKREQWIYLPLIVLNLLVNALFLLDLLDVSNWIK